MYYTYILLCTDGTLYTGITTDPERRLRQHHEMTGAKYTRSHPGEKMLAIWQSADRSTASRLEYRIKRLSRQQKEWLINSKEWPFLLDPAAYSRI